jgi:hypothetical protein
VNITEIPVEGYEKVLQRADAAISTAQTLRFLRLCAAEVMPACRYLGSPGMA